MDNSTNTLRFTVPIQPAHGFRHISEAAQAYEDKLAAYAALAAQAQQDGITIIDQFGTWAVTPVGVECLVTTYVLEKETLPRLDWPLHVAQKPWVDMYDFLQAFYAGRHHHFPDRFPPLDQVWDGWD